MSGGPGVAKPSNEPSAVAAFVWVALADIAKAWRAILRPRGISVTTHGVFCHGSPQVSFYAAGGSKTCELADLLIVIDEAIGSSVVDRRAVLVQAKLFKKGVISISGTSLCQLDLFSRWPPFQFVSSAYNPASRDFTASGQPGSPSESGRYGGIGLGSTHRHWEQIIPANPMSSGSGLDLSDFLEGMALGSTGIGREAIAGGADDWSLTIDELLKVTFGQSVRLAVSIGSGTRDRGISAFKISLPEWQEDLIWPADFLPSLGGHGGPPGSETPERVPGPDGGISIAHISIGQTEERKR